MKNTTEFFQVVHQRLWGDYGAVLIRGIANRQRVDSRMRQDRNSPLELKRTGPFAPSITIPDGRSLVVTDKCRGLMVGDFPDLTFKSVVKSHIARSDWDEWDWEDEEPWNLPDECEPARYVLGQPHSEEASVEMGPLWELDIEKGAWLDTNEHRKLRIHTETWNGQHLFWSEKAGNSIGQWIIVTEVGRDFLSQYDDRELLRFRPCLIK